MRTPLKVLLPFLTACLCASVALAQDPAVAPSADPDSGPDVALAAGPGAMLHDFPADPGGFGMRTGGCMQGPGMERMQVREFRMSGRMEGERGFMLERLLRDSDLRQKVGITDEQAAKIRQESTSFRISEIRNRANLQVQRLELGNLMSADKPDRAAIDKKLEEISATQLAAAKAGVDFRLTMRDALTPEQRAKLKQLAMEHHQFDERGAWGRGGPGGQGRMRMRGQQWQKPAGTPPPTPNPGSGADTSPDSQN